MLTLIALNGQEKGRVFQLAGEAPELLGRQAPTIKLSDAQTSRKHSEILLQNNTWLIRDLGSTNGTWVNGQKISHITELEIGDRIVVGRHQFRVSEISQLPAPTPQPKAPEPEPAIGGEELAAMGVDLSESLSADLLDEDGDLPELPEASLTDDHDATGAPAAAIDEPVSTEKVPLGQADKDDALIDLDALLGEETPTEADGQHEPPSGPDGLTSPDESVIDLGPVTVPTEQDDQVPATTDTGADDGVVDLDALLADEPPSTPIDETPIEEAREGDNDIKAALSGLEPTQKEPPPTVDDGVLDLDAVLNEASSTAPADAEITTDEPSAEETSEPAVSPTLDTQSPDTPDTPDADDELDLDELLGLGSGQDEPATTEASSDEPVAEATEEVVPSSESEPPPTDGDAIGDDSAIDLDALLGGEADQSEGAGPAIGAADVLDDADALIDQERTPDDQAEQDQPAEPAEPEAEPEQEADNLIDIDILGAAEPTVSMGADVDEDLIFDDPASKVQDELPAELDEKPESDTTEVDEPGSEPGDDLEGGSDEVADEEVGVDAWGKDDDEKQEQAPPEDIVSEADKELLLTANEQEQVVSSYRRSKLMTLVILCMCLGVLGVAGWFGYNFYTNRANATSQPIDHGVGPVSDTEVETPTDATDTQPEPSDQPEPETTDPIVLEDDPPIQPYADAIPPMPGSDPMYVAGNRKTDPDKAPTADTAPALADPFADIGTSHIDQPDTTKTAGDSPEPSTPINDSLEPDIPIVESLQDGTAIVLPSPADTALTVTAEGQPESTTAADETEPEPEEGSPATEADTAEELADDSVMNSESENTDQDQILEEGLDPAADTTGIQPSELEALTGAIDAQHLPGDRVAEQAAFAGMRKVVYVVDASGSLVDSFPHVLDELDLAIVRLPKEHAFTVIFFGSDGVTEIPPVGLRWADGQNKRHIRDWLSPEKGNVTAWGRGDALEALQRAINYRPDEVVILSDNLIGKQVTQEEVTELLDSIAEMVGEDVEMIHVIQFFNRDPQQVLKRIAERFNGTYNLIIARTSPSAQTAVDDPLP